MLKIITKILLSAGALVFVVLLCLESIETAPNLNSGFIATLAEIDTKLLGISFATLGAFILALIDSRVFYKEWKGKSKGRQLIRKNIHDNLVLDLEKLEALIPLIEDETNNKSIDSSYEINAPEDILLDYLHDLTSNPKSKIENDVEIKLITKWLALKRKTNKQMTQYSRVDYVKKEKHDLITTLNDLIKNFE